MKMIKTIPHKICRLIITKTILLQINTKRNGIKTFKDKALNLKIIINMDIKFQLVQVKY